MYRLQRGLALLHSDLWHVFLVMEMPDFLRTTGSVLVPSDTVGRALELFADVGASLGSKPS